MEFIFEFMFELIFEGAMSASTDKKVPIPVRIIAALVLILFYGFILGLVLVGGIAAWQSGMKLMAVFLFVVDIVILCGCIHAFRKRYKENNR